MARWTHHDGQPDPEPPSSSPEAGELSASEETTVIFVAPQGTPSNERYALEHLFVAWAWNARFPDGADGWNGAVRALARSLKGLEGAGLIERRTIRRAVHIEALGLAPRAHEYLLHHFLAQCSVAEHPARQTQARPGVAPVDLVERALVALAEETLGRD